MGMQREGDRRQHRAISLPHAPGIGPWAASSRMLWCGFEHDFDLLFSHHNSRFVIFIDGARYDSALTRDRRRIFQGLYHLFTVEYNL